MKREKVIERVLSNQKRFNQSRSSFSFQQSIIIDSTAKEKNIDHSEKPRANASHMEHHSLTADGEEVIESKLEYFDQMHMNALTHKFKKHIDIVTEIGKCFEFLAFSQSQHRKRTEGEDCKGTSESGRFGECKEFFGEM
jgi:hypothetical protein